MQPNSKTRTVPSRLATEKRQLMVLQDIKDELKQGNEQREELLTLLRAAVDGEEVQT